MTTLTKPVRRSTSARSHSGRAIVVTLMPAASDIITVREQGRRLSYSVTVEQVYKYAARLYAENLRAEKAKKRKAKRAA